MYERLREILETRNLKFEIITGGYEERTRRAVEAVSALRQ